MLYGFLLVADGRMQQAVLCNGLRSLILALGLTLVLAFALIAYGWPITLSPLFVLVHAVWAMATWCWLLAFLWMGLRFMTRERQWVRRLSEIAFPFYIVHQTVIIVVGHYVLPFELTWQAKFVVISGVSLLASLALAKAVRLWPVTRFMFGVKPTRMTPKPVEGTSLQR